MPLDSVTAFVAAIRQHELLETGPANDLLAESHRASDLRAFAQLVVKKGWLTPYQANQVYGGHAANLNLGGYRILERLGEGGMGTVLKARHLAMGRMVALKVIRKDRLENDRAIRRFQREIQIAARLSHPNIVLAYDAASVKGLHFFVMEYIEGTDLAHLVQERGPLPVGQACEYIRQAASGLAYAHERGLVHRDIKPANLLVAKAQGSSSGVVKILDLGLARLAWAEDEATGGPSLSQDGSVLGTPDYMAPEQAKNSRNVDGRADIYSLGCTLYYLLTGQVPFPGGSSVEKLLKHQLEQPQSVEQLRPDVPVPVRQVLAEMMAKRPEDRFQKAGEVAEALEPLCDGSAAGAPPRRSSRVRRSGMRSGGNSITQRLSALLMAASRKPRRLVLGVLALNLLGIIGAVVAFSLRAGSSSQPTNAGPVKPTSSPATAPTPSHASPVRYLPENTNFVWVFKAKEVFQSRAFEQHNSPLKQKMWTLSSRLLAYGIDLYQDVDVAAMALAEPGVEPVFFWLFQGKFDQARFHETMKGIFPRPTRKDPSNQGVYYVHPPAPPAKRALCAAMLGPDALLICNDEKLVMQAWAKTKGQQPEGLSDKDLQGLLQRFDDNPSVILGVGGSFNLAGRPLLAQRGIRLFVCGFRVADDVQAEYTLTARDAATAQGYQTKAGPFLEEFFQYLQDPGVLSAGIKRATPVVDDRAQTVDVKARYQPKEMLKLFGIANQ